MTPGTRVRINTLTGPRFESDWSETGRVRKPRAEELPLPGPNWNIVRFDRDGAVLCVHDSMLMACNE